MEAQAIAKGPEVQALEKRATGFAVVTVTDAATFDQGGMNLRELKTLQDEVDREEKRATTPLNEALKTVRGWFRPMKDALAAAEGRQRRALGDYKAEQDRIAAEKRRKAEAEARAQREKLEAEARAAEAKAREEAEAQRREAERQAASGNAATAERLQAAAAATEHKAQARADNLLARADAVTAAPIAEAAPKVEGLSGRTVWKFEITNPDKINRAFLMPDEQKIRRQVAALKGDAGSVIGEGVRIWSEQDFSARRTR